MVAVGRGPGDGERLRRSLFGCRGIRGFPFLGTNYYVSSTKMVCREVALAGSVIVSRYYPYSSSRPMYIRLGR